MRSKRALLDRELNAIECWDEVSATPETQSRANRFCSETRTEITQLPVGIGNSVKVHIGNRCRNVEFSSAEKFNQ